MVDHEGTMFMIDMGTAKCLTDKKNKIADKTFTIIGIYILKNIKFF